MIITLIDAIKKEFIAIEEEKEIEIGCEKYKKLYKKTTAKKGSAQFAITLQKVESVIFVDNLLPYLQDHQLLVIPCHDAIMVPFSQLDETLTLMNRFLVKFLPYGFKLKVEMNEVEIRSITSEGEQILHHNHKTTKPVRPKAPKHKGFSTSRHNVPQH